MAKKPTKEEFEEGKNRLDEISHRLGNLFGQGGKANTETESLFGGLSKLAGNVFYLPDNKLAFIDFGMVGRLTEERREQVVSLLYGMINHLPDKVAEILEDWSDNIYK